MEHSPVKLIECPRDAMQGLHTFVPTDVKVSYLNQLLKVGFDTLDFGSFVSPKAIPQLRDTAEVLEQLIETDTKLLAIVANRRGAETAVSFDRITYLGFPLSVSEEFQQRNTNKSITEALGEVAEIQNLCLKNGKTLVVYLSMGFGNPYGESYSPAIVLDLTEKLAALRVQIIAPSDTVGTASAPDITQLFEELIPAFPGIEFGAHLHTKPDQVTEKLTAAYEAGVRRFDGALRGFGGCPMAADALTGNMPMEQCIAFLQGKGERLGIDSQALQQALVESGRVFL